MCGRFTLRTPAKDVLKLFNAGLAAEFPPRYNIAPGQNIAVVRSTGDGGQRELSFMRWGLVPAWADDPAIGNKMINARGETIATKPAFREAFKSRRCLVVADGFYEWQRQGRHKQPYYITRKDGQPLALAGLWERWKRGPQPLETCTIVTTTANELVEPLHDRMPVIITPEDFERWLDPGVNGPDQLLSLLQPLSAAEMTAYPVSNLVNKPAADQPECVERFEPRKDVDAKGNLKLFD